MLRQGISRYCSTCDIHRVAHVSTHLGGLSYSEGPIEIDRILVTQIETYLPHLWNIFHNGQPIRDGGFKMYEGMIYTSQLRTLGIKASLLLATLYQ